MKKISAFFLSVIACMCLYGSEAGFIDKAFAVESSSVSEENQDEEKNKNESKAPVIITVVSVFTITSAVTAVITYKKKIKSRK